MDELLQGRLFHHFSLFKFLYLRAFADSYSMYDLLAKRVRIYGFVYPFIELALGIAYLTHFAPSSTYIATTVIMGFSSIGVIQSVFDKKKIKCACLGAVFNLPMTTVTIIEDLLMVAMAVFMLWIT
ncbi:MAG: MauE/DoxX family redox-associated membrane protein [Candidatus Scalindua sp.]